MPVRMPLYADNPLALVLKRLPRFDPPTGTTVPYNTSAMVAFIAAITVPTDIPGATVAGGFAQLSMVPSYINGTDGDYAIDFDGSDLSFARLNPIFGDGTKTPYLVITEAGVFRAEQELVYYPYKPTNTRVNYPR